MLSGNIWAMYSFVRHKDTKPEKYWKSVMEVYRYYVVHLAIRAHAGYNRSTLLEVNFFSWMRILDMKTLCVFHNHDRWNYGAIDKNEVTWAVGIQIKLLSLFCSCIHEALSMSVNASSVAAAKRSSAFTAKLHMASRFARLLPVRRNYHIQQCSNAIVFFYSWLVDAPRRNRVNALVPLLSRSPSSTAVAPLHLIIPA